MVDTTLVPPIKRAIKENELGSASPYELSYAQLGASGASFGIFQGDTNVNDTARATLLKALAANNADVDAVTRILAAVGQPCPNGNPLSPGDSTVANDALSCDTGCGLVDAMDDTLLAVVLGELDGCIAAAETRNQTIDPQALLFIALWVNMTGAPDTLKKWLSGTQEVGLVPPVGPVVTPLNLQNYLQANVYFRLHPRNFVHMQDSVNAAIPLLPAA
jgi:hypothetical protein